MKRETYINDVEVDLPESFTMVYKSFLFTGIGSLTAPRTWTVSIPLTGRLMNLLKGAAASDYVGDFPYRVYSVNHYENDYHLINDGKAILLGIRGGSADFLFTFGKAFDIIKSMTEKKLVELTQSETDVLSWNRSMDLGVMTGEQEGFGWVNWYSFTNQDRSFTTHADVPFSVLHPVVCPTWLIERIGTEFSVDLSDLMTTQLAYMGIPLKNISGFDATTVLEAPSSASTGTNSIILTAKIPFATTSSVQFFTLENDTDFKSVRNQDVVVHLLAFSAVLSGVTSDDSLLWIVDKNGVERSVDTCTSTYNSGTNQTTIALPEQTFDFLSSDDYFYIDTPFSYIGDIDLVSSSISFETQIRQAFYEPAATGGYFPIIPNLPDMTCADFIMMCAKFSGLFPFVDGNDASVLKFRSADTIYDNVANAVDWSKKLLKSTNTMDRLEDAVFTVGSYAQSNILDYKADETNLLNTSGVLTVDNHNLPLSEDLVRLEFAAPKRFSPDNFIIDYPLYDIKVESGVLIRNPINQSNDVMADIDSTGDIHTLKFEDSSKFSAIVATDNYTAYQSLINRPRVIKEKFRLSERDIYALSLEIPIYLQQYGKYYAILTAQRKGDITECELLEISNIE